MNAPARLAAFAAALLAVGGAAAAVGAAVAPEADAPGLERDEADGARPDHGAHGARPDAPGGARRAGGPSAAAAPPGLQVSADGLRLALERTAVAPGRRTLRLRLLDERGGPVRDLEVAHEKRLHLIVVRRDLSGFQHLHPTERADGTWVTKADLRRSGTWRVLADFTRGGRQTTLGADLHVAGLFMPRQLPAPARTAMSDRGLRVEATELTARRAAFSIDAPLQPHLGAAGHLVALRAGDLAYAHTHPEGDRPAFGLRLPGAGTYRLFLQVRSGDEVHTAAFTHEVAP